MEINNLKQIINAPSSGYLLAYCVKKVVFQKYDGLQSIEKIINTDENGTLLEIHLFDDNKEYRAVSTESSAYGKEGFIEHVAGPEWDGETYEEIGLIEKKFPKITDQTVTLVNHLSFDENGMAFIDDYRLKMGGRSYEG